MGIGTVLSSENHENMQIYIIRKQKNVHILKWSYCLHLEVLAICKIYYRMAQNESFDQPFFLFPITD